MQVQIENYRGWEIVFDTETESFYCHSEKCDRDSTKKSYSATKKFIDDFIKDNNEFRPFWIESGPDKRRYDDKKRLVIGIRKDGRFVWDNDGEKEQVSEYFEKDYVLVDEANAKVWAEMKDIAETIDLLHKTYDDVKKKAKCVTLKEYKKQITNQ